MDENGQLKLERQFNLAFDESQKQPWKSERGCDLWIETETLRDCLAGPLSKIVETGGCGYVYGREDAYFREVRNPTELMGRLREWHNKLVEVIDDFRPTGPTESADFDEMHMIASEIWNTVQAAYEIERRRFKKSDLVTD